jgi:uncharacterized protein
MTVSPELLKILVCPETKQEIRLAEEGLVARLNAKIASGELKNRAGKKVAEGVDGALVRKDERVLYVIRDDIPVMLIDEAVPMDQLR